MKQLLFDLMIVQMSNFLKQMSTNFHFRFFICLSEKFSLHKTRANLVGGLLLIDSMGQSEYNVQI